jgi:glycosyltransferase involved in cell wall biosynthesis
MADPAISVVVPTHDRAPQLTRLLDAIAECEAPPGGFEVVVVDDGSTDDTATVLATHPLQPTVVRQAQAGAAAARNRGWRSARAELVLFVDDDCVPDRTWLVDHVEGHSATAGISGLGGAIEPLVPGRIADFVQCERLVGHAADQRGVRYLVTANASFTRDAIAAVGGFDESFPGAAGEDADLGFRLLEAGHTLAVTPTARVRHDHRTSLRRLLRTYYRHGSARHRLVTTHPGLHGGTPARRALTIGYWRAQRDLYAAVPGTTPAGVAGFLVLRAAGLLATSAGTITARRG